MKKILDFFRKRKNWCIIFSAVLVVVIVAVVVVAVNIPYDEENAAELNAALQQAETSDVQDQDNEGVNAEPDTSADVTETAETGQESADSNAAGKESSVNTGSNTAGSSASTDGSGPADSTDSVQPPSGTSSDTTEPESSPDSSGGISHQHIWQDHVTTVTVVDVPAQSVQVTEYHMYYWDSKTWQISEDPDVFKAWERQKMEWMRTYRYENNMPPELFKGYDQNGHPQYTNDHSIVTYYKNIPAVTHEEQRVDYQYCTVCGITK